MPRGDPYRTRSMALVHGCGRTAAAAQHGENVLWIFKTYTPTFFFIHSTKQCVYRLLFDFFELLLYITIHKQVTTL